MAILRDENNNPKLIIFKNIFKPKERIYYISFGGVKESNNYIDSWVVRTTKRNLDISNDLIDEIEEIEKERGYEIVIHWFKELKK